MRKKISLSFLILLVVVSALSSAVSFAASYSGGLIDGEIIQQGTGPLPIHYKKTTLNVTDNNETTYATLDKGSELGPELDGMIYDFPTPTNITGYQLKLDSKTDVNMTFYKKDGSTSVIATSNLVYNGTLTAINVPNVVKVHLHNSWSATTNKKVYEMNFRGIAIPVAPALSAIGEVNKINLSWNVINNATGYTLMRSETSGGPYTVIAENLVTNAYQDSDVLPNKSYYYVVVANNQAGKSSTSNEAEASLAEVISSLYLDASGNNETLSIELNWVSVTGATYYQVKRSLNQGGPYTVIESYQTGEFFVDYDVTPGVKYYYVVTADTEPSTESNEASAMIDSIPGPEPYGRALLTIYISGGQIKEYDLSGTELSAFLNWYDTKDAGNGPAKYAFTKTWNKGPFKSRTEYVIFDKILTFDVDEYEGENP